MKRMTSLLATVLAGATLVTYTPQHVRVYASSSQGTMEKKEINSLKEWKGKWNNILTYYNSDELKSLIKELAEVKGKSEDELLKEMAELYKSDFDGFEVTEDSIILYKTPFKDGVSEDKEPIAEKYTFKEEKVSKGKHGDIHFYIFTAENPKAEYKTFALLEEHGKVMPHVHFKYSKEDIDKEIANDNWWPTVVREDISVETVKSAMKDRIKKAKEEKAKADVTSLEGWKGSWNNINLYFEKAEAKEAFKKLGQKNSETAEKAEEKYRERRKSDIPAISIDKDTITFLDSEGGKEKAKGSYKFVKSIKDEKMKIEWFVFTSEDAPQEYKNFLLMKVHGDGLTHFHTRYGKETPEELMKKDGWFPTFIEPSSTMDAIAEEIAE